MSAPRRVVVRTLLALGATLAVAADAPPPAGIPTATPPAPPPTSGLIEKTGVALYLLDIEVRDRSGAPMRGLTAADFLVRRNGRAWPVVTADDFCSCDAGSAPAESPAPAPVAAPPGSAAAAAGAAGTGTAPAGASPAATPPAERPLVVIYFDFGQLRPDGRHIAVESARRWVKTVRDPGDRVMIAGYVTSRGVLTLQEPTTDLARLLAALDDAQANLVYSDVYAQQFPDRIEECHRRDPATCPIHAMTDYNHGRRSIEGLKLFLAHLGLRPGAKTVLYFQENGQMEPGLVYKRKDGNTQYRRVEEAGAEATAARATIHPLQVSMVPMAGVLQDQWIGIAATLAESTGGTYNRGGNDLDRAIAAATTGCRCRYVLGLEPLPAESHAILGVSVTARGVKQRALYRVRSQGEADRFLRQASAVLENPGASTDLAIGAAIRPLKAGPHRWDLAVDVAADARVMSLLPAGASQRGSWETGARLQRLDTNATWDMLATSVATSGATGAPDTALVYTHAFTGLAPGRYRLSAFMRDKVANLFGGGEAILELPDPAKGGVAGPVMLLARSARLVSPLPLMQSGTKVLDAPAASEPGPSPPTSIVVPAGARLRFESFVCVAPGGAPVEATASLWRDDTPVLRLDDPTRPPAEGGCAPRVDEVMTAALLPGRYLYLLVVRDPGGQATTHPAPFAIAPSPPDDAR